jgi:rubrerythrin
MRLAHDRAADHLRGDGPTADGVDSADEAPPHYLCRTCGTTFEGPGDACPACHGLSIELISPEADKRKDAELVENPP